jgi:tRNA-uridine 2-sulfurtransferase
MNVYVALSGGVDSAVSAALLKSQGRNVVGCFIKIWQPEFTECTWREDRLDAMRVCASLKIPYKEIDLSQEYMDEVVSDMISAYKKGITPNPDVLCNRSIKFGSFSRWAFSEGADVVATGHYARIHDTGTGHALLRGLDSEKDQSYFLWRLTEIDLSKILFPIGALTKPRVRAKARELNLPVARKHDSQGLCFVGDITLPEFLSRYIHLTPGDVVDETGKVVGIHNGAALYTVGQRHGYTHSEQTPLYITSIHTATNIITVSPDKSRCALRHVFLSDTNWLSEEPTTTFTAQAQARYREKPFDVEVTRQEAVTRVAFKEPHVVAEGQSLVVYRDDRLLGGGIIQGV